MRLNCYTLICFFEAMEKIKLTYGLVFNEESVVYYASS